MSRKRRREPRNASLSTSNTSRSSDSLTRPNNKRVALPQNTHKPSTIEPYRRRYLMLKTAAASIFTLALAVAVPSAHAQFGSGIVFDPTQSTHAYTQIVQQGKSLENEATQIEQGTRIYTNAVKMATTALNTYGTVMRQYNLYHQMVQSPRMLYSRFLSPRSDLFLMQQIGNTYGNSMGWVNSSNTGTGAAAAWQQVSVPTTTSTIAGYNNLTIAGQQQIAAQGATIDIGDSVTSTNLQALGTIRANQQARQADIATLESQTQTTDTTQQTELATLQRINVALLLQLRSQQDANQINANLALQQIVAQKQQQDAMKAAFSDSANYGTYYRSNIAPANQSSSNLLTQSY